MNCSLGEIINYKGNSRSTECERLNHQTEVGLLLIQVKGKWVVAYILATHYNSLYPSSISNNTGIFKNNFETVKINFVIKIILEYVFNRSKYNSF